VVRAASPRPSHCPAQAIFKGERGEAAKWAALGSGAAVLAAVLGAVISLSLGGSRRRR
jgi:hypothetical protein